MKLSDRARFSRNILVSEFLVKEWAEHFVRKTKAELNEIVGRFRFERCVKRDELNEILKENAPSWVWQSYSLDKKETMIENHCMVRMNSKVNGTDYTTYPSIRMT